MQFPNAIYGLACMIFLLGIVGLACELALLDHFRSFWQLVPHILLLCGITAFLMLYFDVSRVGTQLMNVAMLLMITGGLMGIGFHFSNNLEFERELRPHFSGLRLWWESLAGAVPTTAPGAMILLGATGKLIVLMKKEILKNDEANKTHIADW